MLRTKTLLKTIVVVSAIALLADVRAADAPVKVRLHHPLSGIQPNTEVEVVSLTPQMTLVLRNNGNTIDAAGIDLMDFIACSEAYGDAKGDPKIFYSLTQFFASQQPEIARRFATRAVKLDKSFTGDAAKRVDELCDVITPARKKLLGTAFFATDDEPKTGPRAHLLELARQKPLNKPELKKAYLDLQEARVFSQEKMPFIPTGRKDLTAVERAALAGGNVNGLMPFEKLNEDDAKELKAWFAASPSFREMFLLALEPGVDFYQNAARVALKIRAANPKDVAAFEPLVVAFATSCDNPRELQTMDVGIPELFQKPAPACTPDEAFGWFVKNQAKLCPGFQKTPWRLMAYVAADTGAIAERDWVLQNYKFTPTAGKVYAEIVYDNSKLKDNIGKLAGHPYTLANLKTFGGVCRDQAFFARSVCRYFGMPAYFASGMGKSGGIGHAWVGWVTQAPAGGYAVSDYGRYADDKFYTATVTHPRTGEVMLDYILSLEARGMSDEKSYNDADLLFRVFQDVGAFIDPKPRYEMLIDAVRSNAYHRQAWLALAEGTASGAIPQNTAAAQWDYLTGRFKEYPDFTLEVLGRFVRMFKDIEAGYNMFEATAKMYLGLKREDLAARLRLEQIDMCVIANRKDIAFTTAMKGAQECANTGASGVELAKKTFDYATDPAQKKQALDAVRQILARTPKKRIDEPSDNWIDLANCLLENYRAQGDEPSATKLQAEISALFVQKK